MLFFTYAANIIAPIQISGYMGAEQRHGLLIFGALQAYAMGFLTLRMPWECALGFHKNEVWGLQCRAKPTL